MYDTRKNVEQQLGYRSSSSSSSTITVAASSPHLQNRGLGRFGIFVYGGRVFHGCALGEKERSTHGDRVLFSSMGLWEKLLGVKSLCTGSCHRARLRQSL